VHPSKPWHGSMFSQGHFVRGGKEMMDTIIHRCFRHSTARPETEKVLFLERHDAALPGVWLQSRSELCRCGDLVEGQTALLSAWASHPSQLRHSQGGHIPTGDPN
jgi:hypothetical protein